MLLEHKKEEDYTENQIEIIYYVLPTMTLKTKIYNSSATIYPTINKEINRNGLARENIN